MKDYRIPACIEFWENPKEVQTMAEQWDENDWKEHHEELISAWVGEVESIADLGCGVGRFAKVLENQYEFYIGFDGSKTMFSMAQTEHPELEFALVDIFNFSPDEKYDLILMIDVAQHQVEPIKAIQRMLNLWVADRYLFSLIVAEESEELLLSNVVGRGSFNDILCSLNVTRVFEEPFDGEDKFSWVLIEVLN